MARQDQNPGNKGKMSKKYTWKFFLSTQDAWDAMYKECEEAKISIELEQYIFEADSLGNKFMELFIKKAREKVKVILICDKYGSLSLNSSPLLKDFKDAGGFIHFYHPLRFWHIVTPWWWFPRIHTKTLLIDSEVIYTGGVCIAERMRHWRDTQIRFTGPIISDVREAFDAVEKKYFFRKFFTYRNHKNSGNFYYLHNWSSFAAYKIYKELVNRIRHARKYIYITSLFFVPNRRFLSLLKKACARGVEIRLMVPEHSDLLPADWVYTSYIPKLLSSGVKIYHYRKSVIHCKTMVIDDEWATVGSTNMDIISFFYNREANVITTDKEAVMELKQHFSNDLKNCIEIDWNAWGNIPLWKKTIGYIGRLFKIFLR